MAYPYNPYQQTQSSIFVRVKDENEMINYPIAPGCSVLFIDESISHLWVKTAGLSQFDRPSVEKYRLTKENAEPKVEYATKQDIAALEARIAELAKGAESNE